MLIGEILSGSAGRDGAKAAIVMGDDQLSYAELDQRANRIANALLAHGFGAGHNIAIYSINHTDYASVFFGAAKSGVVLAHLSTRFTLNELTAVIANTDIEAVFVHASQLSNLLGVWGDVPTLKRVVVFGGEVKDVESLDDFIGDAPTAAPDVEIAETDAFAITYTGGTTGFPKGVVVNHASRVIGSVRAAREFALEDDDIFICSTPLFHIAGLFVWFQTGILMGCTCIMMPGWDVELFVDLVENKGGSGCFLVPTQMNGIISHPDFDVKRLKNLRFCSHGGAPTSEALLRRLLDALPDVVFSEQYGQSESGNLTVRAPEFNLTKSLSVGRAFTDLELAVFDADDKPVAQGAPGEVVTRGTHVMMRYYNNPEQTADVMIEGGWIKTGDVGYLDEDGFLYLVDRSKDMFISGGENVFPTEIENALYDHPAVNECAVFGIPDDHWGELPAAHVVLSAGESVSEQELMDFCETKIARHKRPRMIKFVESMPKTAVGKIQKNLIREPYWQGQERKI